MSAGYSTYTIGFKGDTTQLKASIDQAVQSLNKLATSPVNQLTPKFKEAAGAALDLSNKLQAAVNVNTGKLDLTKFSASIGNSAQAVQQYATQLKSLGPAGQRAFMQVAQSVSQATLPMQGANQLMGKLWITLKNTARWQLSSRLLMGFIGGIQNAFNYARELDKSLNSIRIVSGQSADQMQRFAKEANNAAKALSSTTTAYTKAALIFYQQGLRGDAVTERVETVIKMANVTGDAADQVSSYMTAIWNNFDDGSKSLEHYADVMTALGAATASSTSEIAQGLEKFAAVAETVGLTYEYATTALATVVAQTRQSADVVGTAFKTLFARIQDLELGETLDDGVTLGKYSQALDSIGVSILDATGNVKDMNNILDEMGTKWDTLTEAQKVSTAQTVAGVRQYTQLIALMDNWDTFQENLQVANTAEGTLGVQAEIYAQSWEAAKDRVKASTENIYDSFINPQTFIDLNNTLTPILNTIASMIDGLGGLKGVLTLIAFTVFKLYGPQVAQGIDNIKNNILIVTGFQKTRLEVIQQTFAKEADVLVQMSNKNSLWGIEASLMKDNISLQQQYNKNAQKFTQDELNLIDQEIKSLDMIKQKRLEVAQTKETSFKTATNVWSTGVAMEADSSMLQRNNITNLTNAAAADTRATVLGENHFNDAAAKKFTQELQNAMQAAGNTEQAIAKIGEQMQQVSQRSAGLGLAEEHLKTMDLNADMTTESLVQLAQQTGLPESFFQGCKTAGDALIRVQGASKQSAAQIQFLSNILKRLKVPEDQINQFVDALNSGNRAAIEGRSVTALYDEQLKKLQKTLQMGVSGGKSFGQMFTSIGGAAMQAAMRLNAIKSLGRVFSDEDLSFSERLTQGLMAIGMLMPILTKGWSALTAARAKDIIFAKAQHDLAVVEEFQLNRKQKAQLINILNTKYENEEDKKAAIVKILKANATDFDTDETLENAAAGLLSAASTETETKATLKDTIARWANVAAQAAQFWYITIIIAVIAALIAIIYSMVKAWNADSEATKQAAKDVESAKQEFQAAKEELDKVNESLDTLADKTLALQKAAKGTEEWNQALRESNDIVSELLRTYPELAKYIETSADGIVSISQEGQDWLRTSAQTKASQTGANLNLATIRYAILKQKSDSNEYADASSISRNYFDQLTAAYKQTGDAFIFTVQGLQNTLGVSQNLAERMMEEGAREFGQLKASIDTNSAQINALTVQIVAEKNVGNEDYQLLTDTEKQITDIIVAGQVDNIQKGSAEWNTGVAQAKETLFGDVGDDGTDKLMELLYGENWKDNYRITHRAGSNFTIQEKTEGGGWKNVNDADDNSWTQEWAAETYYILSQMQADDQDIDTAKAIVKVGDQLEKMGAKEDESYAIMEQMAKGNVTDLTSLSPDTINQLRAMSAEELNTAFGEYAPQVVDAMKNYSEADYENFRARKDAQQIENIFAAGESELEISAEALESYTEALIENNSALKNNKVRAAELTVESFRLGKAFNEVESLINDNIDVLNEANEMSMDYHETLGKIQIALEDAFGVELSTDFVKENLEDIKAAVRGDEEALRRLRLEASKEMIVNLHLNSEAETELTSLLDRLSAEAANTEIGADLSIDGTDAFNTMNQLLADGSVTIDQLEAAFKNAGLELPEYHTEMKPGPSTKTVSKTKVTGPLGITYELESETESSSEVAVPYFGEKSEDGSGNVSYDTSNLRFKNAGNAPLNQSILDYSGDSGGSNSKPEEMETEELGDAYRDVNRELERHNRELEKTERAIDRAFGTDKIKLYEKAINNLKNKYTTLVGKDGDISGSKYEVALQERQKAYGGLLQYFSADQLKIDPETGELLNANEIEAMADTEYNAFVQRYNSASASEQENMADEKERVEERHQTINDFLESYITENDTMLSIQDEAEQLLDEISSMTLDKITESIQIVVDTTEARKQLEEFYKTVDSFLGDDVSSIFDNLKRVVGPGGSLDSMIGMSSTLDDAWNELLEKRRKGEINDADFEEGRKEILANTKETVEGLIEVYDSFETGLEEALESIREAVTKFTDTLDANVNTLSSLKEIMVLQGVSKDSDLYKRASEGIVQAQRGKSEILYAEKQEAERKAAEADAFLATLKEGDEGYEEALRTSQINQEHLREINEEFYSSVIDTMTTMKENLEETLETLATDLDKNLTQGYGSDWLQEKFDNLIKSSERYLDIAEETYEVSKWNRKLNQEIDKANSIGAKNRLKALKDEIELRRQNNKLTQYDLDILNAKYNMTVAQIALEESRNSKTTMRLTRNAAGNWAYVYTANAEEIAAAEEKYEDATHDYYTASKERVKNLAQELLAIQTSAAEKITEIMTNSELTEKEKSERILEVQNWMKNEMIYIQDELGVAYEDMYNAQSLIMENTAEKWDFSMNSMKSALELLGVRVDGTTVDMAGYFNNFQNSVNHYLSLATTAQREYQSDLNDLSKKVGVDANSMATAIGLVEQKTKDAKQAGLDAVKELYEKLPQMGEYAKKWGKIGKKIDDALKSFQNFYTTVSTTEMPPVTLTVDVKYNDPGFCTNNLATGTSNCNNNLVVDNTEGKTGTCYSSCQTCNQPQTPEDIDLEPSSATTPYYRALFGADAEDPSKADARIFHGSTNTPLAKASQEQEGIVSIDDMDAVYRGDNGQIFYKKTSGPHGREVKYYLAKDVVGGLSDWIVNTMQWEDIIVLKEGLSPKYEIGDATTGASYYNCYQGVGIVGSKMIYATSYDYNTTEKTMKERSSTDSIPIGRKIQNIYYDPDHSSFFYLFKSGDGKDRWYKESDLHNSNIKVFSYDTGGYTGDWNSSNGRLAMLHQKELVLNAQDTENILSAVSAVRLLGPTIFSQIESVLDNNAKIGYNLMGSRLGGFGSINSTQGVLEQQVSIQASFPNVHNAAEIEEALNNIVNDAAQYASIRRG